MNTLLKPRISPPAAQGILRSLLVISTLILAACASGPPAPTAQLAASSAAIDQAVDAGASDLAPSELSTARDKLERAYLAMKNNNNVQALILAEQAQVDAQLAVTRARTAKATRATRLQ
ncbi:DUF4398 domain-containing protein [Hylemonella gracilis]|uniref:DUF4398 domain-containing protein n=1 Tax=Hylemonella gracilis TaxID=80880 RepID=UPI0012DE00BB|nr:DUF4398 domain-containing protein [Hylemonella gracilis]